MRLIPSAMKTKRATMGHRRGPASKNVQSTARSRSNGGSQVAGALSFAKRVFNGRPKRGE